MTQSRLTHIHLLSNSPCKSLCRMKDSCMSDMSHATNSRTEQSGEPFCRRCLGALVIINCFLLVNGVYVKHPKSINWSNEQYGNRSVSASALEQSAVVDRRKRPVTVADSIQMTRLGDAKYTDGLASNGIVGKFSPDGRHFVIVLKKGNLEENTNEYSLVLFNSASAFQSPTPRVLFSLASSSNRPAIKNVNWLDDNDTILFLGERPGERTQLYSVKCSSNQLTELTSSSKRLTSFVTNATGAEIVYTARTAVTFLSDNVLRRGIAVTNEAVTDLIRGSYEGNEVEDLNLFVKRTGKEPQSISTQGRVRSLYSEMSLSPDGAYLLVQTEAPHVSSTWSEYEDAFLQPLTRSSTIRGEHTSIYRYELVDTITGKSRVLVDTPIGSLGSEMAWSPDSKSLMVSDVFLPLSVGDPKERALRKTRTFLVEFNSSDGQFVEVSHDDLRLISWNSTTGYVSCDVGRIDSLTGKSTSRVYFRKSAGAWIRSSVVEQMQGEAQPDIILDEGMNTPPHIVAIDPTTGRRSMLMDLNPQFKNLIFAPVQEITWKDSRGNRFKGGLYWPPAYILGRKYPLILQTHGWNANRFWMDGPWTTAFAAQALAAKGFFVLQTDDPDWHIIETPKEAASAMAAYESAIDYLDGRGIIDRNRVGITGFSRTYWYVTYALTHSKYHFAAAALADGVDYSYFQYMAFSNANHGIDGEYAAVYGGPPLGRYFIQMLKQAPSFFMDKIETPIRIQTLGPQSLLADWHWYSGLYELGKPVEMIYIPEAVHIVERPWDRMVSQQGNVDWFCFWLKEEEDPDPAKSEQYARWRALRGTRGGATSTVNTQ
jgi:hypothetical protein